MLNFKEGRQATDWQKYLPLQAASPARREAPRLRTVASRGEAPPAPAPAAKECARHPRSSAPTAKARRFQCGSRSSPAPRQPSGNHDTMRCIVQQAATRPERRDPAACCALAEPRHYTRLCV
jgi:hypothetical protein